MLCGQTPPCPTPGLEAAFGRVATSSDRTLWSALAIIDPISPLICDTSCALPTPLGAPDEDEALKGLEAAALLGSAAPMPAVFNADAVLAGIA